MAKSLGKSVLAEGVSEFAVTMEGIVEFFDPPIAKSTFYDLRKRGKVIPLKGLRGYYCLNESLVRLGMKPVTEISRKVAPTAEEIGRFALWVIEPELFICPARFMEDFPALLSHEYEKVLEIGRQCEPELAKLDHDRLKIAYGQGMIAALIMDSES